MKHFIYHFTLNFLNICSPLSSKDLDGLELTDYANDYEGNNINILIGTDHYWGFATGDIIRGDDGPAGVLAAN